MRQVWIPGQLANTQVSNFIPEPVQSRKQMICVSCPGTAVQTCSDGMECIPTAGEQVGTAAKMQATQCVDVLAGPAPPQTT